MGGRVEGGKKGATREREGERLRIDWKRSLHRKGEGRLILYRRPPMPLRPRRSGRAYVG